ncbi:hypothetical protein GCM10008090_00990 [Arenicella chitinivorans]|uniref:Uncharacterized protein n=1 Tax=Arenicella chitinivorans TaxID=1329800 RepID=A0A918RF93_9GAMM|nr:hypothetical protein [Arenicella chitinivorans]GGZ96554.1 hypothetical protein GCM10008090_00990 [Arenicella chitinivorans]
MKLVSFQPRLELILIFEVFQYARRETYETNNLFDLLVQASIGALKSEEITLAATIDTTATAKIENGLVKISFSFRAGEQLEETFLTVLNLYKEIYENGDEISADIKFNLFKKKTREILGDSALNGHAVFDA